MPVRTKIAHRRLAELSEPPTKRVRLDIGGNDQDAASGSSKKPAFTSGGEIEAALKNLNPTSLVETLTAVRNQLSISSYEGPVAPQDPRLLLAQHWMEISPGAHDLFSLWDTTNPRQPALPSIIVSVFTCLLSLLTSHYTHHASGHAILKILLTPQYLQKLNSYVGGGNNELTLTTLKLYCAMSDFGSGREKKAVLEGFAWEIKAIPKLFTMRRRGKGTENIDNLKRPDIRTSFVLFVLSFLTPSTTSSTKTLFLTQHAGVFNHIFKGLVQDHYNVIRKVFEMVWAGIWADPKVRRSLKITLFGESTINHILKLYERSLPEELPSSTTEEEIPADLAHHFLLAICTRPGVGICFRDRGWYPREAELDAKAVADGDDERGGKGKIYNKILSNIVKTLKVNEDARHQELALKFLTACPELVAGYWPAAALTLEPRLSSRWLANIAFFGSVISLPVPSTCFLLPSASAPSSSTTPLYNPIPPPLLAILENTLPNVNTKAHFTKGLQTSSGLVQHCSAVALIKCLEKYSRVQKELLKVSKAQGEEDSGEGGSGLWSRRGRDLEREARKRVPEFMVVVAFAFGAGAASSPKDAKGLNEGGKATTVPEPNEVRKALLAEVAQRLMKVYQQCFPAVTMEAKFDVGKLLLGFEGAAGKVQIKEGEDQNHGVEEPAKRLDRVKQLHMLKLLQDSDQFIWTGKAGSSTYFRILLTHFTTSHHKAIRQTVFTLVTHLLSTSTLFSSSSPEEAALWLACLPSNIRSADAESPDGAQLTDERQTVVAFLDDCVSRCVKVVYKYLEELDSLCKVEEGERSETHPSPLLMTVLEQLEAKLARSILTPSDGLALATFVRKLMLHLYSLLSDTRLIRAFVERIDSVFGEDRLWKEYPVMASAVRAEVRKMRKYCGLDDWQDMAMGTSDEVTSFLNEVEKLPVVKSEAGRIKASHELVDWLRLVGEPLNATEVQRLSTLIENFNPPTLAELSQYTEPRQGLLWEGMQIATRFNELRPYLTFEWLFMDAGVTQIIDESCRTILTEVIFMEKPKLSDVKKAVRLVLHWLACAVTNGVKKALYLLLASFCVASSSRLPTTEFDNLKEMLFVRAGIVKESIMSSSVETEVDEGLSQLANAAFKVENPVDRKIAFEISSYWLTLVRNELGKENTHEVKAAYRWIKYLNPADLFDLVDNFANSGDTSPSPRLLKEVLDALSLIAATQTEIETSLVHRLPQLLSLLRIVPNSVTLEILIAVAIDSSLPVGVDGKLLRVGNFEDSGIVPIISHAVARWNRHTFAVPSEMYVERFLTQSQWTDSTVKIITGLLYRKYISKDAIVLWLSKGTWVSHKDGHIIPILQAFLDTCNFAASNQLSGDDASLWTNALIYATNVTVNESHSFELRTAASFCIASLLQLCTTSRTALVKSFLQTLEKVPITTLTAEVVSLGCRLQLALKSEATTIATVIVDRGIQWSTRALGSDSDADSVKEIFNELTDLLRLYGKAKPHLVETLITVVIQQQLGSVEALQLATAALQTAPLKPVLVNRFIQTTTQHPQFIKLCASTSSTPIREALVNFLYELFILHPTNTCQATHIQPLVSIYQGTVSGSDLKILSVFQLFESERKISVAPLLSQWSPSPNSSSSTSLEAIQSLDPILMLRTCLNFPGWRRMQRQVTSETSGLDSQLYDPIFLMLMFTQMLTDNPPSSAFGWIELFRTNTVGLFIRALSSKDGAIRDVALSQLTALWLHLQTADLQEKPHVLRILSLLKNVFPPPSDDEPPKRLPSYTTLVLMHALRGVFYPSNFIYPLTARFLLQRPEIDTSDVPMLYGMLYSSSDDWKKERGWILRFLSDGMLSRDDWAVFKRRHTWDLLASLYQSSETDRVLRHGVLEVLANLTVNSQAASSLVLKSALLSWIEMNIRGSRTDQIEWVKIIENLLVTLDASKIESATNGRWRGTICRCVLLLLTDGNAGSVFPLIVSLILRLSLLPGPTLSGLSFLLDEAVKCLKGFEAKVSIPRITEKVKVQKSGLPCPPHRAHGLHELPNIENHLQVWGQSVEMLWRVAMELHDKPKSWDPLTSRLLIWRAIVGDDACYVGEWARTEAARNIV